MTAEERLSQLLRDAEAGGLSGPELVMYACGWTAHEAYCREIAEAEYQRRIATAPKASTGPSFAELQRRRQEVA